MSQYRDFLTNFRVTSDNVILTSEMSTFQKTDVVLRDGSFETNFKAAVWAHLQIVLGLNSTATTPPCSVQTPQRWHKTQAADTITTSATIITVPPGNSGILILHRDTGSFTMQYSKNAGSYTTFADGATITVANGDTLSFKATSIPGQDFANGSVLDSDTGALLDSINLYNTMPP